MMVKDDSLYLVAIVAVVAVVGLVVMATGSTVVAEDSTVDSDAAIAGQASYSRYDNNFEAVCRQLFYSSDADSVDLVDVALSDIAFNLDVEQGHIDQSMYSDLGRMNDVALGLFQNLQDILLSQRLQMDCELTSAIFDQSTSEQTVIVDSLYEACDGDGDGYYEQTVSVLTTERSSDGKTTVTESVTVCDEDECSTEEEITTTVDECYPKLRKDRYYHGLCEAGIQPLQVTMERLLLACLS